MSKHVGRNFLEQIFSVDKKVIVTISLLFIICLGIVLGTSSRNLDKMAQHRAVQDMRTIAAEQVYFINKTIERNFSPLEFLSMYIADNHINFASLVETEFLNELTYVNEWASVGFADKDGFITEGFGRKVGNIYHRKYFKDIYMDGQDKSVEFIHNTIVGDGAKTALSVPIMDGDKISGVLFCLKETASIESFLLGDVIENSLDFFICDSSLDIFAGNEDFQSIVEDSLDDSQICSIDGKSVGKEEFLSILAKGKGGVVKINSGVPEFLCFTPIGVRDIFLFTKVGVEASTSKYIGDFKKIHFIFVLICILFIVINGFLFFFSIIHIVRKRKLDENLRFEKTRNAIMLDNLNCDIFDYNIEDDEFWTKKRVISASEAFDIKNDYYPGFDKDAFLKEFDKVKTSNEKQSFEIGENGKTGRSWFQVVLTPYYSATGAMTHIFGVVVDKTKEHSAISQSMELAEELQESKIKNSIAQMQPHFLYNALGSIREIILDDPQYASELVYDFTTHLRACIRSMQNNDLIPFEQELTNIKAYVNIEKMRFGDKLKLVYDTQFTDFKVVPLGIQPLVENSIRHGIYKRGKAGGTVIVRSYKENDDIVIQVKDDGVGFDYEQIKQEIASGKRDSTGMQNLVFRFKKMMGADVDVQSETGVGSTITIRFKENV